MKDPLYKERFEQILERIEENPDEWDQTQYHCGTTHCIAGFAECFASHTEPKEFHKNDEKDTWETARKWLGLTDNEASLMFYGKNDLNTIKLLGQILYD